jgi:hypothetical protein
MRLPSLDQASWSNVNILDFSADGISVSISIALLHIWLPWFFLSVWQIAEQNLQIGQAVIYSAYNSAIEMLPLLYLRICQSNQE